MVGRGAAKNLGNRKNIGNSIHEDSTSFVPRLRTYACQPQINDIRLTEDENPNMDVENEEIHNDLRSGFASNEDIRAQLGKRKRTNKLNTRISKALGANVVVADQPIQRREENANRRNRENNGSKYIHFMIFANISLLIIQKVSQRNSKNRLSKKRTTQTTGNLSFAEVEHIMTEENNGVKPSADVIWLIQHTTANEKGNLEWADESRSKEIHEQLKNVVATHGDTMTQEEILLDVLKPRSGYFRGKGTALPGFSKGRQLLEHQSLMHEQQKTIQEQQQLIKELQESQERTANQLEESQEATTRQLQQQKEETQRAMDAMKKELLQQLSGRVIS